MHALIYYVIQQNAFALAYTADFAWFRDLNVNICSWNNQILNSKPNQSAVVQKAWSTLTEYIQSTCKESTCMKYEWIFYLICIKLYFGQQLNNNAVTGLECKGNCVRVHSVRFQTRISLWISYICVIPTMPSSRDQLWKLPILHIHVSIFVLECKFCICPWLMKLGT